MELELLKELAKKFSLINKNLYLVGGAVRDILLDKDVKDFDFVTDASIDDIKILFPEGDYSFADFGFVKINFDGEEYDISVLRKEIYHKASRHPDRVEFINSIEEDSLRRDFTINALYFDKNGKVFDFHGGINDLNNRLIRMIGNPLKRIKEDPLRILRALRLKMQLNFNIEEELLLTIKNNLCLLNEISRYQIQAEIKKMKQISLEDFLNLVSEFHLDEYIVVNETEKKLHVIDLHCDTITSLYKKNEKLMKNNGHIDIHRLIKNGYLLQCFAIFLHQGKENIDTSFEKYYEYYLKETQKNSLYLKRVYNYKDLMSAKSENKVGVLLTIEEGEILHGKLEKLEELYSKGVRMITLTWNYPNCLGEPNVDLTKKIVSFNSLTPNKNGLTEFGKRVVKKMNELGMIIDVSHLSDQGFYDVISLTDKPIVASHSNARSICNVVRNLTDEMILLLHKNGGVMGINYCADFVSENKGNQIKDIVRHIKHIKDLGCIDNISLGSDFDGIDTPNGLSDCGKIDLLYEELINSGFTKNEIEKIFYKNFLRVMKNVLK